jgi:hypothetical protein
MVGMRARRQVFRRVPCSSFGFEFGCWAGLGSVHRSSESGSIYHVCGASLLIFGTKNLVYCFFFYCRGGVLENTGLCECSVAGMWMGVDECEVRNGLGTRVNAQSLIRRAAV